MLLRIVLCIYCLFISFAVSAQKTKKSTRYYSKAIGYEAARKKDLACRSLAKAIAKDPKDPDAYALLGQWYFELHKFKEAADVFRQATLKCRNGAKRFAKPYARCLIYAGKADIALQIININYDVKDRDGWERLLAQANFVRQAMLMRSSDWPQNLGCRINSDDPDLFPSMAVDTETLYFTRRVSDIDDDLFKANADSCGGWFYARNLGDPPNSPSQESSQFISADGHYLFFTRCDNRSEDGIAEGGCDLYMAYRASNQADWTIAQPFGSTINTPYFEGMPSLSPDNRELYFVSDREGGYGGYDIWISRFENGLWQLPINAGPSINTSGNETAPYIAVDNKTLYFTSDGWPGMGGSDIFMSRKLGDTTWVTAMNLGYPLNTPFDEKSECASMDGKKLYFASDRNGPPGNYDIFESELPEYNKALPVSYLHGFVYDSLSKERLNYASIYISDRKTGENLYQFQSNRGDASFLIVLQTGHTYIFHTERMGYTEIFDTIYFSGQYQQQPLEHNVVMLPTDYVEIKPINDSLIATLHFDVNRVEMSDEDKSVIRNAISPWLEEKGVVFIVNAYTDNTGTPMINEELSYKRASIVAKTVLTFGIDETSVMSKGWGEAKMLADNGTEEGRRKNRRVEIIIRR